MIGNNENARTMPKLLGFLSDHESKEKVATIAAEPDTIYLEEGRESSNLNFDFIIAE